MTRRHLASWAALMAGVVTLDVANDRFWWESVSGLLFALCWILMTREVKA